MQTYFSEFWPAFHFAHLPVFILVSLHVKSSAQVSDISSVSSGVEKSVVEK